jgi:hypothetical protein
VPEDLAEDAHPGDGLTVGRAELQGELADEGFGGVGGKAAGVAGGLEDVEEKVGEALAIVGGGGCLVECGDVDGVLEAIAGELIEADGDGLAEVHGEMADGFGLGCGGGEEGDGGEEMAVAELVVGEASFFGAEEESDVVMGGEGGEDLWGGLLEGEDGLGELSDANGGGADDEGGVGDGCGQGVKAASVLEDGAGGDGGAGGVKLAVELGGFKGSGEVVDEVEVREAEVVESAGGGADVERVARANEDGGEVGAGGGGEHGTRIRDKGIGRTGCNGETAGPLWPAVSIGWDC